MRWGSCSGCGQDRGVCIREGEQPLAAQFSWSASLRSEMRKLTGSGFRMFLWHNGMQVALSGWAVFLRRSLRKMQNKFHVFEMAQTPIWRAANS